jgi:hypothetical protein
MKRRDKAAMAVAALVAGTVLIVHANWPARSAADPVRALADNETSTAKSPATKPPNAPAPLPSQTAPDSHPASPVAPPAASATAGKGPDVLYDLNLLPPDIKSTLEDIVVAAQGGNIDDMLPVLEQNELPPMLSTAPVPDPIAFWKKASADGQGHDILAAMLNIFSSGFVRKGSGKDVMYIWPYFAEIDLKTLTPSQQVELYRLMPASQALAMQQSGKYTYYRAGIGSDGVWHYFLQ